MEMRCSALVYAKHDCMGAAITNDKNDGTARKQATNSSPVRPHTHCLMICTLPPPSARQGESTGCPIRFVEGFGVVRSVCFVATFLALP